MNENYDGVLVLGTALDTQGLEKQLREEEKKLQKFQNEHKKLGESKLEVEADLEPIEKNMKEWQESIKDTENDIKSLKEQLNDIASQRSVLEFGTPEDTALFQQQQNVQAKLSEALELQETLKSELQEINGDYDIQKTKLDEINQKLIQNEREQDNTKQSIQETNAELQKRFGLEEIKNNIGDINKGLSGIVKKALKWGLAIFGIRTMFNFIRSSMSTIAQGDPQLKADMDYIKNILAYVIEPVVRKIIEWAKGILTLIGAMIYRLTKWNIFKDANENLKKAKNNAQALQKTMTKFDEMNTLSGGNNTPNPSFDFSLDVENYDFDKTYGKIKKTMDKIKTLFNTTFDDIQGNIEKSMLDAGASQKLVGYWHDAVDNIQGIINGIGTTFSGVFDVIWGILSGDGPLIIKGFGKIGQGIWDIVSNLIGFIINSVKTVIQFIKEFGGPIASWVYNTILQPILSSVQSVISGIITALKMPFTIGQTLGRELFNGVIGIFNGILSFFRGDFKGGLEQIGRSIKQILLSPLNAVIEGINQLIKGVNKIKFDVPDWVPGIGGNRWGFNLKTIPKIQLAKGGILNNPGKGVPVGYNAIAGESGKEFYMPLQDEQMLQLVGQSIGKYITINANITNTMNGRIISRELQKIQNDNDFAFNR